MRYLAVVFVSLLIGCTTQPSPPPLVSGESILIRGIITAETATEFRRELTQSKITRVLLDSGGGDVESAIEIANLIKKHELDVDVIGKCYSSCANYLFPAGRTKTISELGIVAWHGNAHHLLYLHKTGRKPVNASDLAVLTRLTALESAFFDSIGVDQFICWFGKIEPFNARNLYFLSKRDMERFGIREVMVRADYGASNLSGTNMRDRLNLRLLSVDWSSYSVKVPE